MAILFCFTPQLQQVPKGISDFVFVSICLFLPLLTPKTFHLDRDNKGPLPNRTGLNTRRTSQSRILSKMDTPWSPRISPRSLTKTSRSATILGKRGRNQEEVEDLRSPKGHLGRRILQVTEVTEELPPIRRQESIAEVVQENNEQLLPVFAPVPHIPGAPGTGTKQTKHKTAQRALSKKLNSDKTQDNAPEEFSQKVGDCVSKVPEKDSKSEVIPTEPVENVLNEKDGCAVTPSEPVKNLLNKDLKIVPSPDSRATLEIQQMPPTIHSGSIPMETTGVIIVPSASPWPP